jgi:hypothetical protein
LDWRSQTVTAVNAPQPAVVFVIGSIKEAREVKPIWRPRPKPTPWHPADSIPQVDKAELQRRARELRETYARQIEALRAAGDMLLRLAA